MSNKRYRRGAAFERRIKREWEELLKKLGVQGCAIRSAGSRGDIDVLLHAFIGLRDYVWGVQGKLGYISEKEQIRKIKRVKSKKGIDLVFASRDKKKIIWYPFDPFVALRGLLTRVAA